MTWDNPQNKDVVGVKIVKNPYRAPISYRDGQELYIEENNFTYDTLGAKDISKYFSIFTYDNVPNYSKPVILEYLPN